MYAIIEDGGKQYKVGEGETVLLEKKAVEPGESITLDRVLMLSKEGDVRIGKPLVEGAKVTGTVKGEEKGKKLVVMRFRRRKDSRTKTGHRQHYTAVTIDAIEFPA